SRNTHCEDADALIIREANFARSRGAVNRVHENVSRDIWLVAIRRMAMRADQSDLVALHKSAMNVVDAPHSTSFKVSLDDHAGLNFLGRPRLTLELWHIRSAHQVGVSQSAVPLSN